MFFLLSLSDVESQNGLGILGYGPLSFIKRDV